MSLRSLLHLASPAFLCCQCCIMTKENSNAIKTNVVRISQFLIGLIDEVFSMVEVLHLRIADMDTESCVRGVKCTLGSNFQGMLTRRPRCGNAGPY